MEIWTFTVLILTLYGSVIGWNALSQVQQGKQITAMSTMVKSVEQNTLVLSENMKGVKDDVEKLSRRFDEFMSKELDTLKDIAKSINLHK